MRIVATFTVSIDTDNAAFERDEATEVARILHDVADQVARSGMWRERKPLRDINGNAVGTYGWAE